MDSIWNWPDEISIYDCDNVKEEIIISTVEEPQTESSQRSQSQSQNGNQITVNIQSSPQRPKPQKKTKHVKQTDEINIVIGW